jgi:hypothetical protein
MIGPATSPSFRRNQESTLQATGCGRPLDTCSRLGGRDKLRRYDDKALITEIAAVTGVVDFGVGEAGADVGSDVDAGEDDAGDMRVGVAK